MSLIESRPKAKGFYSKPPPRDVVHSIQSYGSFFVNTKIKSGVIVKIIFFEELSSARTSLILTLKKWGCNTHGRVKQFSASKYE